MHNASQVLRRQRTFRLEAIILRHKDWGEADRMIWMFSRQLGKVHAIAKGVRKPRSRKAGHLEPFTRVNLLLAKGRNLDIITQAETLEAYLPIKDDLMLSTYAAYVVELFDRFTFEGEENRALYRLLVDTFDRLAGAKRPEIVVRYFEVRFLDRVGFRPQLFSCAQCGVEIKQEDQFFSFQEGGVLCPRCGKTSKNSLPVSVDALKYLRHFQRSSFAEARRAVPKPGVMLEIERLMQGFFSYLAENRLNTPPFLNRLRHLPDRADGESQNVE